MKDKIKYFIVIIICICSFAFLMENKIYAYTDTSLYTEKLEFDDEGNLVMSTHDKKATSSVIYRTIGWVIKRYDMPMNAKGQQYAVIPANMEVKYIDDPNNSAYVYCYYYGDKITISDAIGKVSAEWKKQLYNYGDYVYIDEIMTVIQNGNICGGLNGANGSYWGEVYFNYEGIAGARPWASKESLRTHFDKRVYFPSQVYPKYFSYKSNIASQVKNNHTPSASLQIGAVSKYDDTYDVTRAVPTGTPLYISGKADRYFYKMTFDKNVITFYIPIKLITTYTLKWKGYDGRQKSEKKEIVQWYYVTRTVSYYTKNYFKYYYLTGVHIYNYALKNNVLDSTITGLTPKVLSQSWKSYNEHVSFPKYKDEYYIDGGVLSQMNINGVKPSIPDVNRQTIANSKVGTIKVRNDYLKINNTVILDSNWIGVNGNAPYTGNLSSETNVYSTGHIIPHEKQNKQNQNTTGYYVYKEVNATSIYNLAISKLNAVSIHTPVFIGADLEQNNEDNPDENPDKNSKESLDDNVKEVIRGKEFNIRAVTLGQHRDEKGYGIRDYRFAIEKIEVKFDCDITEAQGEEGRIITAGTWFELKDNAAYIFNEKIELKKYNMDIRAFAKNYKSIQNPELNGELAANLNYDNYMAYNKIEFNLKDEKKENLKYEVVGTH